MMIYMAENEKTICFDHSHNNKLSIESSSYSEFIDYIFSSGFKVGHIKQGISAEKLNVYNLFIIGCPFGLLFDLEEIEIIEQYVKNGGSLFIISDGGGDHENETNLNDIAEKFGFKFNSDFVLDSMNYIRLQDRPIIDIIEPHPISLEINKFVHSSGCSLFIDNTFNSDKNIEINVVGYSGLNSFLKIYDGETYIEKDIPKNPVLVAIKYYKGRIVGLGNISIFSSLSSSYGYSALDNSLLLSNIINWLISVKDIEGNKVKNKLITIPINYSLSNNFPNPFNPSTKMEFSIPQTSNVVIKVFDILGNEIETIISEEKQIGTYEITWYSEGLPSGVYFYRLQAGDFVETKKMLLLK